MNRKFLAYTAAVCLLAGGYGYAQDDAKPSEMEQAVDAVMDESEDVVLESEMDKVSYAIGIQIATEFNSYGFPLKPEMFAKGIKDANAGAEFLLDRAEIAQVMQQFQQKVAEQRQEQMAQQQAEMQGQMEGNKKEADEFLAENLKKDEVSETESGLQYMVLEEGSGPKPDANDTVRVHYHGKLLDGTVFDSSVDRGEPIEFELGRVIEGWQEGLQLMKEGARWRLFIPPGLAYREMGSPPDIPPNSALIFDVELIKVIPNDQPVQPVQPAPEE